MESRNRDMSNFSRDFMSGSDSDDDFKDKTFFSSDDQESVVPDDISAEWIVANPDLKILAAGIRLNEFLDLSKKRNLAMEFRILVRITETNFHSKKIVEYSPENAQFNRYCKVVPCKLV